MSDKESTSCNSRSLCLTNYQISLHIYSRLSKRNAEATKALADVEVQSKLQESQAIPLFHEKQRLQTELESLQAHSNWLEKELQAKSHDYQHLQQESRDRSLQLQLQLEHTTNERDAAQVRLEALQQMEEELQEKVNLLSKDILMSKQDLISVQETSEAAVREERRLVRVQEEHIQRWQQRYNDVVRENEGLKELANRAMEANDSELKDVRKELESKYQKLLKEQAAAYEEKLHSQAAVPALPAPTGTRIAADEEDEPLNMTDLYTRLEQTKLALEQETIQRKHCQTQFSKVEKEIANVRPRMLRQVKEYELAVEQVQDYQQRLSQVVAERDYARQETREAQQEVSTLRQAVTTRKMESEELAKQVQALLVSRAGGEVGDDIPTSIEEIQVQNQRLLLEQRRLDQQVQELETKLDEDVLRNKLEVYESERAEMLQQRKEQEVIVDKITLQRDLYRSLLATKDPNLLDSQEEETSVLEIQKKQSERSRKLKQLNKELEAKLAAARAEVERISRDKEAVSERLARHEAHSVELNKTVDTLERDLLSSRSETARAVSDSQYHKEKCERLETALDRAREEAVHVANAKNQLQKINAELQQNISTANGDVTRLEGEKRHVEGNTRLLKAQLETAKSSEARATEENSQLRSEIARQGAIIDSVRRIEARLSAKSESEKEELKGDVDRLSKAIADGQTRYSSQLQNLNARIEQYDARIQELSSSKDRVQSDLNKSEKISA